MLVDVWCARVVPSEPHFAALAAPLSPDERDRARNFARPADRVFFAACRGLLRRILAGYLDSAPGDVRFVYSDQGKPGLPREAGRTRGVSFNVAHSDDTFLVAVCRGGTVGVDVERVRTRVDYEAVVEGFFAPGEQAALARIPAASRRDAFFRCWTRKEAWLKARGTGMATPLHGFEVSCPPAAAALLRVEGDAEAPTEWTLRDLDVRAGWAACVAVDRPAPVVRLRRWSP